MTRFVKRRRQWWRAVRQRLEAFLQRAKAWLAAAWAWIVNTFRRLSGELRRGAVLANMVPGDIILASPRTIKLSPIALAYRLLLRSRHVHSMLYLGGGRMLHTTDRHGVVIAPVPRRIFKRDRYTVLRAPSLRPEERRQVVQEALKSIDAKLDRAGMVTNVPARLLGLRKPLVRMERNRLWCSKLIERAYAAAGVELVPPEVKENVTSEDLSRSPWLQTVL